MSDAAVQEPVAGSSQVTNSRERKVLILGCGPAGLIAARTLEQNGLDTDQFDIVADEAQPSRIGGAQFLHRPLFGETEPDAMISVAKIGDSYGYAEKVYGKSGEVTSFDRLPLHRSDEVEAWSLIKAYERLWEDYRPGIHERHIDDEAFAEYLNGGEYTEIISTIPPSSYCHNPVHDFESVPILIAQSPMDEFPADNFVLYSGRLDDAWYRISCIFGEESLEFGSGGDPQVTEDMRAEANRLNPDHIVTGMKPTRTTCDCGFGHPHTKLLRVGRFGSWDRRVLLHQVPSQVASIL